MPKILVVDDEPGIINLLREFLRKKNYEVITASGGAEALQKVETDAPDLIILDVRMPGMSGLEVLKEIMRVKKDISVVMATAVTDEEIGRAALQMGAFDYVIKPFDLEQLEKILWWKCNLMS